MNRRIGICTGHTSWYSYSKHAEFCQPFHLYLNHFCVFLISNPPPGSHGKFISVHVLPLLPGVQHTGRGTGASVDMHRRGWTAWHIWNHTCHSSSAADSGKYCAGSFSYSVKIAVEWVQDIELNRQMGNINITMFWVFFFNFYSILFIYLLPDMTNIVKTSKPSNQIR